MVILYLVDNYLLDTDLLRWHDSSGPTTLQFARLMMSNSLVLVYT